MSANNKRESIAALPSLVRSESDMSAVRITGDYSTANWFGTVRVNGQRITPKRSLRLRNHSPTGFAWGYSGSGPAQLALAILLEVGIPDEVALQLYQNFKREFIAPLERDKFSIEVDITSWMMRTQGGV